MSIKFNGIANEVVTFKSAAAQTAGTPVKMSSSETVAKAANGDVFFGFPVNFSNGLQGVQIKGYVEAEYTGTAPTVGYVKLVSNGSGVKVDAQNGREYLVVSVNTTDKIVGFFLN